MSQSVCQQCGSQLFLGEQRCATCKAPAPASVAAFGQGAGSGGGSGPPPEGLSLIVQKGLADQDIRNAPDPSGPVGLGPRISSGDVAPTFGESFDSVAEVMRVERDRDGNVIWDWKNALVGGIVVAVVVGLAVYWITAQMNGASFPGLGGSRVGR